METPHLLKANLLKYDLNEVTKKYMIGQKLCLFNGPKRPDFKSNLLSLTKCPVVFTEDIFQDFKSEMAFLIIIA